MASLLDPVGPLDRGVYWRRRLILLGILLVVLLIVFKACSGGDDGGTTPTADSTPTAGATTSKSPKATSSAKASSSPSASSSASASSKPIANCKDSDVVVTARPAKSSYAVGDAVTITYVVSTKGDVKCKRDVGGAADEVRVLSGSSVIWSSDYCSPGGKADVRTIGPDDSFSVVVEWDGDVTSSSCPDDRLPAPAGVYNVQGRNGSVLGTTAKLTLG